MGQVHADFTLVNLFTRQRVDIRALVDTGATEVYVTWDVANALGFDPGEVSTRLVTVADGRRVEVPRLAPVEIEFGDRGFCCEVLVLGDECLMGVIPLEALDLIVDLRQQKLIPNPAHPEGWRIRA
jgi:clan AA aspartic protease